MAGGVARVKWERLPHGVMFVKRYRTSGSLVECGHANEHQRPTGGWAAYKQGSDDGAVLTFDAHLSEKEVRAMLPVGYVLDYGGALRCTVCGGDESTTDCFKLPVKMFVDVKDTKPQPPEPVVETLF